MHSFKSSVTTDSLSFTYSDSSHQSNRRLHEPSVIFATRLDYALLIIGLQTGVMDLMAMVILVEMHGGALISVTTFVLAIFVTLPLMVYQVFYGFYNKYGFIKHWNMAPIGFGIGFSMALYSVFECVLWAAVTGLLILQSCHIPFRSISEWTTCPKIVRPEGVICYDAESNFPATSCHLTTYPALEFYKKISYGPQLGDGDTSINGAWFACCVVVWLIVFVMVSQGFRRLRRILIRISIVCLLALIVLVVFSFSSQPKGVVSPNHEKTFGQFRSTQTIMVWLLWHAVRVIQLPLGTLYQLGSYFPPESPLIADAVMILLFTCFYNLGFAYFANFCLTWIELDFVAIGHDCLATDVMTALFGSIPTAISLLAMGNLWLFLFYTMFALKTIIQIVITLTATINALSEVFRFHRHRQQIVAVVCTVALLLDLPFTMTNSEFFFIRIYRYIELIVDFAIGSCTAVVIIGIYSLRRVFDDMHFAYDVEPVKFQRIVSYLSPIFISCVFITGLPRVFSNWLSDTAFTDGWTWLLVSLMALVLLLPIPGFALYVCVIHLIKHNVSRMIQPTAAWGPSEAEVKTARLNFNPRTALRYRSKNPCTHHCLLNNLRIKIEVEKRDTQRKEFFLNVFQSPSYADWDDTDEDWPYGHDIMGKARTIDWSGDFKTVNVQPTQATDPIMVIEGNEERREDGVEDDKEKGEYADVEEDQVESGTKPEEDVNVVVDRTVISKNDDPHRPEMDFEPDIILPDFNTIGRNVSIKNLDTHHAVDQPLPRSSPCYTGDPPTRPRRRRHSTKGRVVKHQLVELVSHVSFCLINNVYS